MFSLCLPILYQKTSYEQNVYSLKMTDGIKNDFYIGTTPFEIFDITA